LRKTIIEPWNSEWIKRYENEKELLMSLIKDEIVAIHHIGSTSLIEVGFAKPIIDVLIEVSDIHQIDSYNELFEKAGYIVRGENGIPLRRYFIRGENPRIAHIHVHEVGDPRIKTHLNFKKYIQTYPRIASEYGQLKIELAKTFPDDTHKYQEAKNPYLENILNQINEWEKKQ